MKNFNFSNWSLCALLMLLSNQVISQTNTFPTSGNVGIGTTTPGTYLHIKQDNNVITNGQVLVEQKYTAGNGTSTTNRLYLKADRTLLNLKGGASLQSTTNGLYSNLVINPSGGRVGVGNVINSLDGTFHVMEHPQDAHTIVMDVPTITDNPNLLFSKAENSAANIRLIGTGGPEELQFQIGTSWNNNIRTTLALLRDGNIQVAHDKGTAGFNPGNSFNNARGIFYGDAGAVFDNNNSSLNISGRLKLRFWVNERSTAREAMTIHENGNISTAYNFLAAKTTARTVEITGGSDLAEPFDIEGTDVVKPGSVVVIDVDSPGQLKVSDKAYDKTVAGIVSGAGGINPGLIMTKEGSNLDGEVPVALSGRVYCWVDASENPVIPGDLLTTSNLPGFAMKASDPQLSQGAIIGKAMTKLDKGQGLVLVLVSLQ